jgi:D-glycero-D-manno-heptose 1,7-bisphosphate phosphatase
MLYIFDLDGTLIASYMNRRDKNYHIVELLPNTQDKLNTLLVEGHQLGIVTNQAGVAFGHITEKDYAKKINKVFEILGLSGDSFPVSVCFSEPRSKKNAYNKPADCARRKPSGAMIREIMAFYDVQEAAQVMYIGDRPEDKQAATNAGVSFMWAWEFFDRPYPEGAE